MSHFSLIIVSGKKLSEESLGVTMNPFFESSDPEDENVQFFQMDNNEEALKEFVKHDKDPEYPTFDTFLEKYYGYKKNESGYYGYWKNPQAKWDWYEVGGRFANHLVSKSGMIGDSFMVQDLDFEIMAKEKKSNAESVFDDSKKEDSATRFFQIWYQEGRNTRDVCCPSKCSCELLCVCCRRGVGRAREYGLVGMCF